MNRVRHFGLIPDGGRRWAHREKMSLRDSYSLSFEKIGSFAERFFESGGDCLSLYMLSKANLARGRGDLDAVVDAEVGFLESTVSRLVRRFPVTVRIAGREDLLPQTLRNAVRDLCLSSREGLRLFLCLAYDPFDEVIQAVNKLPGMVSAKTDVLSALWVPEEVDLVVRTGGAITLSNFLPLQCAYARVIFMDKLFNDVDVEELISAIRDHEEMDLKFGG